MNNEEQVFGCSLNALKRGLEEQVQLLGTEMLACSILSDAQEMMDRNMMSEANQMINRAKWLLGQEARKKREELHKKYAQMSETL